MPRENGLSDQKVVLNNPLAFMDDYLNKYFQNCSEFIQFFTDVRILAGFPREFSLSRKMCLCLVEAWEACFPFHVCCVFVWSQFEFLLTRRPPFSSSSLPFSFHGGLDLDPPTTPVLDSSGLRMRVACIWPLQHLPLLGPPALGPLVSGFLGELDLDLADHAGATTMMTTDDEDHRHHQHLCHHDHP